MALTRSPRSRGESMACYLTVFHTRSVVSLRKFSLPSSFCHPDCSFRGRVPPTLTLVSCYCIRLHTPIDIDRFDENPTDALDVQEGTQPYRIPSFWPKTTNGRSRGRRFTKQRVSSAEVSVPSSRVSKTGVSFDTRDGTGLSATTTDWPRYAAQTNASSTSTTDNYYGDE